MKASLEIEGEVEIGTKPLPPILPNRFPLFF